MDLFQKAKVVKFSLVFVALLVFSAVLSPLTGIGTAYASTVTRQQVGNPNVVRDNNCSSSDEVKIYSDWGADPVCFTGTGSANVHIYNVVTLLTGAYTLNFHWTGCDKSGHNSTIPPGTEITGTYGSWAGCNYMTVITYINLY